MTTVAWDGTTLAGDTLGVIGDSLKFATVKVYRLSDGRLFGASGRYDHLLLVHAWLEDGGEQPKIEEFAAILIDTDGSCARLEESLIPMPIQEPFHAVGSGRDFAIAAMALGQTAAQAVELAMRFDPYTGGEIQTLALEGTLYGTQECALRGENHVNGQESALGLRHQVGGR